MTRPHKASETTLRRAAAIDTWFDALWATALGVTLSLSGYRFLNSAAWQRVIEWTPGGRTTLAAVMLASGLASLLLIKTRWRMVGIIGASGWCFFVASFQVYSAFQDEAGPLGFFAWYYVSFQILRHAFQDFKRLQ